MHRRDNLVERLFDRKNIAFIVLVVVSAFVLSFAPVRGVLTEALFPVAVRLWKLGDNTSSAWNSFITNLRSKDALVSENDALHADVLRMQAQVLDRNILDERVIKLEESLGRSRIDDRVVADVLAGPNQSVYDTLVIDAGSLQGIEVGNMVAYANAGVAGEVVEVSSLSAKVKLYSSPGEQVFMLVGPHSIPVTALGKGMGNFEAKIAQDSTIAVGDTAVSPKGSIILGVVSDVEGKPAEPFKRIFLRVPFNITEMRSVEVIVNKHH